MLVQARRAVAERVVDRSEHGQFLDIDHD